MAWKLVKSEKNGTANEYMEFMVTAQADLANIPDDGKKAGNVAYTEDLGHVYMCDMDGDWNEI